MRLSTLHSHRWQELPAKVVRAAEIDRWASHAQARPAATRRGALGSIPVKPTAQIAASAYAEDGQSIGEQRFAEEASRYGSASDLRASIEASTIGHPAAIMPAGRAS